MASAFDTYLSNIKKAVYGSQVRDSIVNALSEMSNDISGLKKREKLYNMSLEEIESALEEAIATAQSMVPADYTRLINRIGAVEALTNELQEEVLTLNEGGLILDDDKVKERIDAWLLEHPEASTTVLDGMITEEKLSDDLRDAIKGKSTGAVVPNIEHPFGETTMANIVEGNKLSLPSVGEYDDKIFLSVRVGTAFDSYDGGIGIVSASVINEIRDLDGSTITPEITVSGYDLRESYFVHLDTSLYLLINARPENEEESRTVFLSKFENSEWTTPEMIEQYAIYNIGSFDLTGYTLCGPVCISELTGGMFIPMSNGVDTIIVYGTSFDSLKVHNLDGKYSGASIVQGETVEKFYVVASSFDTTESGTFITINDIDDDTQDVKKTLAYPCSNPVMWNRDGELYLAANSLWPEINIGGASNMIVMYSIDRRGSFGSRALCIFKTDNTNVWCTSVSENRLAYNVISTSVPNQVHLRSVNPMFEYLQARTLSAESGLSVYSDVIDSDKSSLSTADTRWAFRAFDRYLRSIASIFARQSTNGLLGLGIRGQRRINNAWTYNELFLGVDSSGKRQVTVSESAPWREALGLTMGAGTTKTYKSNSYVSQTNFNRIYAYRMGPFAYVIGNLALSADMPQSSDYVTIGNLGFKAKNVWRATVPSSIVGAVSLGISIEADGSLGIYNYSSTAAKSGGWYRFTALVPIE